MGVGREIVAAVGDAALLPWGVLRKLHLLERPRITHYAAEIGHRSLVFVSTVMGFVGVIMVVQSADQALQIIGDLSPLGPVFLELLVREMGPAMVGVLVAARSGAALAAEAGMLTTREQLDALRLCGSGATAHLMGPALLGSLLVVPCLAVFGTTVAYASGGIAAHYLYGVGWETYFTFGVLQPSDLWVGMVKAVAFAVVIPTMAIRSGLAARGGAAGVGRAATYGVISASVFVLAADLFISIVAHLLVWG